uniref:DUF3752 domain-containing protein n=1 Tax=Plectus sambesii TaxID=2011161 RepID=A0A914WLY1_9BILA
MSGGGIGPSMPPGWKDNGNDMNEMLDEDELDYDEEELVAPQKSPSPVLLGPALPPGMRIGAQDSDREDDDDEDEPNLPGARVIGPTLPPDLIPSLSRDADDDEESNEGGSSSRSYGPSLPPDLISSTSAQNDEIPSSSLAQCDEDEDDFAIGPLPPGQDADDASYEQRLFMFQARNAIKNAGSKREEWMTQLPKKLTSYGLGARTFQKSSNHVTSKERSEWTESPADKIRKQALGEPTDDVPEPEDLERMRNAARDQELEARATELNKTRTDALIDMHQRKRKQDSEVDSGSAKERKPFDRETDLHLSGSGGRSVKELKEKASGLSSRFGHSSAQKFL